MANEQKPKPAPIHDEYDFGGPINEPLTPEAIAQIEATCGPVPKSKGGTGPERAS